MPRPPTPPLALLRAVLAAQTEWIVRQAPDGRILFANPAYCRHLGLREAEPIGSGHDVPGSLAPDERARFLLNRARLTPERPSLPIELTRRRADGSVRFESWIDTAIFDAAGRVTAYQAVGRDVTEQRLAQAAIQASEELHRDVVEAQTELITRVRPDGQATFVNDAYCRYMGMTREQLLDPAWDDLSMLSPEERAAVEAEWSRLTPEQPFSTHVCNVVLPNGRRTVEIWYQRGIFDNEGRLVEVQGVGRDITEQRRAEEALRESEERYRAVVEDQTEVIARFDADFRLTFANGAYGRLLGRPPEALLGHDLFAGVAPAVVSSLRQRLLALTPDDPVDFGENEIVLPDGDKRWFYWTNRALFDREGRLTGYQAVGRDITERRQAEQALQESERRFRAFAEAHPVPLCALRTDDWRVLFVNPAYLALFQLTLEELDRADKRTQWADPDKRAPYYERLRRDGRIDHCEVVFRRKDGTAFPALISSRLMRIAGTEAVVNSVLDLTAQRRAEEALRASERHFRSVVEANPMPMLINRVADRGLVFVNRPWLALNRLSPEEALSFDRSRLYADPADRERIYALLRQHGAVEGLELVLRRADGTDYPAAVTSRLIEHEGEPAVVTTVLDLTREKLAEAEIARQREALHQQEKLTALGSLLAGVAHELNNPLSVVVGYASLLRSEARGKKVKEQAERIHAAAERCARIVKSFLAMARQRPPRFGPVDLAATVAAALELAAYALRTSGVKVATELPADLPPVHGDSDQLHQVLANLVINAKQALQESAGPRRIAIRAAALEGYVQLTIADNGPGMAPEVLRRAFEPFFTTKPQGVGTGLGLAVCHGIIATHGGRIHVESEVGQGTRVILTLPIAAHLEAAADQDAAGATARRGGGCILVVDDEAEIADLVAGTLGAVGHKVEQVADGEAALARIARGGIDLVISDLRMPGMDGVALLRELRRQAPALARSALLLTGDLLSATGNPELSREQVTLIEKPIDLAELRRAVEARLPSGTTP